MVMEYLKKRTQRKSRDLEDSLPDWVSEKNASFKAWRYVEELKKEKKQYIGCHCNVTDYLVKKTYQIKGTEVAKAVSISRASLMNTSKYSNGFRKYLEGVNAELDAAKNSMLKKSRQSPSRGSIRNSKDDLLRVNIELKKRVTELEEQKTDELVRFAINQLPLPIKRALGID